MIYDEPMPDAISWRVLRVRLWLTGHTEDEINRLSLRAVSDIVAYWTGKAEGESKLAEEQENLRNA